MRNDLLRILDNEIAARAENAIATHPDWPCRRGCDHCCRHLSREPELTEAEWQRIEAVIDWDAARERVRAFDGRTCPFLDAHGACSIYDARPIACRTYGFYVERGKGLYCADIERRDYQDVVWGNQAAIDHQLDALGPRISMRRRFRVE